LLLHCKNGSKAAPQCYVIRTLPVWFSSDTADDGHFKLTRNWTMSRAIFYNWTKRNKKAVETEPVG